MTLITKAGEVTTSVVKTVTPEFAQRDNFFSRNKVKLLGLVGLTASFLLTDPTLAADLPPKVFPWVVRGLSLATIWVGFLNNPEKE